MRSKRNINSAFLFSIILLVAVNIIAYMNIMYKQKNDELSDKSSAIIKITELLKLKLSNAESSCRGYLLTQNNHNLKSYYSNIRSVDSILYSLQNKLSGFNDDNTFDTLKQNVFKQIELYNTSVGHKTSNIKFDDKKFTEYISKTDQYAEANSRLIKNINDKQFSIIEISGSDDWLGRMMFFLSTGTFIGLFVLITAWILMNKSMNNQNENKKIIESSRKWLSIILSGISDGLIAVNNLCDVTYINLTARTLLNAEEDKVINLPVKSIFDIKGSENKIDEIISNVLKSREKSKSYKGYIIINGQQINIKYNASPLFDESGYVSGVILIFNDISEFLKSELEIKNYQLLVESIANSIPNILYIYNVKDFSVIYVNAKIAELTGYSTEDIIKTGGENLKNIIHPDDLNKICEFTNRYENAQEDEIIETEVRLKNKLGQWRWFFIRDIVFKRDADGKPLEILGSAIDITDKKTMEEQTRKYNEMLESQVQLRTSELKDANNSLSEQIELIKNAESVLKEQEEFLKTIIDINPNLIFVKDENGFFTIVNKAVADIYGQPKENLIGKKDSDFNNELKEVENFQKDDLEVINNNRSKIIPEERVTSSLTGETRYYQTIKVPMKIKGRKQVLGVSTDITSRKQFEEQILYSLEEKEKLLQEIHHRVKNNLQIIISLLKMQTGYIYDDRDKEILNKSRARVETMSIIHDKLYKKAGPALINLGNYFRDLAGHLFKIYSSKTDNIKLIIESDDISVNIDTVIPCGLIINELISNSIKFADPSNADNEINIKLTKNNGVHNIIYRDNGIGIADAENMNNNSLGLKIIKTLVEQLEGSMVISSPGGAQFNIDFKEIKYKDRI